MILALAYFAVSMTHAMLVLSMTFDPWKTLGIPRDSNPKLIDSGALPHDSPLGSLPGGVCVIPVGS
jgi:hypothetical protein